ncbi:MAG: carbohydrate ABC transporter substrate-binding protein, partial [Bacilli bacterium]
TQKYPELNYLVNYDYAMPATQDGNTSKTFADSKGVVIYAHASTEQVNGMLAFFEFAFTDENDLKLLEITNMPPARSDLLENEVFVTYFKNNPEVAHYAMHVKDAIPAMADKNFVDIQEKIGERMLIMINDNISASETWSNIKEDIASITK